MHSLSTTEAIAFIQKTLGCGVLVAVDVYGRATRDPAWFAPPEAPVGRAELVWRHFDAYRLYQLQIGAEDPAWNLIVRLSARAENSLAPYPPAPAPFASPRHRKGGRS